MNEGLNKTLDEMRRIRNAPQPHPSLQALIRFREKNDQTIEKAIERGDKTEMLLLLSMCFNEGWHAALRHHGLKR